MRTLESLGDLRSQTVVVRCDLNVPLKEGVITDDGRIRASLPTINALVHRGAKVIVISHLGRPDGSPDARYSLRPAAQRLSELLGAPVTFAGPRRQTRNRTLPSSMSVPLPRADASPGPALAAAA